MKHTHILENTELHPRPISIQVIYTDNRIVFKQPTDAITNKPLTLPLAKLIPIVNKATQLLKWAINNDPDEINPEIIKFFSRIE